MAAVTGSIEQRRFVTMRFKRIKTWAHVYHVRRHNTREMECLHLEADAPEPVLLYGDKDVSGAIKRVLDRYGVRHRPGEVIALEFVVSASREVFDGLEKIARYDKTVQLYSRTMGAFKDRFGIDGQIVSVMLHLDERTPHLHLVVVPLILEPDNRRKDKSPHYRLSAKRVVGGRGDMSREQTRFASYFADMGLERGKERSGARHVSNREHEGMLEEARHAALEERDRLADERRMIAEAAIGVAEERDALAAERAQLERSRASLDAEKARLQEEEVRLVSERTTMMEEKREAEALKARAIKRTLILRDLLEKGEELRAFVLSLPDERRTARMRQASTMVGELTTTSSKASQDDAWLATVLAYRPGGGKGATR